MSVTIYLSDIGVIATCTYEKTSFDTCFNQTMSFIKNVLDNVSDNVSVFIDMNIQTDWVYSPDPEIYILNLLEYLQRHVEENTSCDVYLKIAKNDNPPVYKRLFRSVVRKDMDEDSFNNTASILFSQYEQNTNS